MKTVFGLGMLFGAYLLAYYGWCNVNHYQVGFTDLVYPSRIPTLAVKIANGNPASSTTGVNTINGQPKAVFTGPSSVQGTIAANPGLPITLTPITGITNNAGPIR